MNLKTYIIDDSLFFQHALSQVLEELDYVEMVGSATTGKIALKEIPTIRPDVITLDIEMPGLNGLDMLPAILECQPKTKVIMVSSMKGSFTKEDIHKMSIDAYDVITKPMHHSLEKNVNLLRIEVRRVFEALKKLGNQTN